MSDNYNFPESISALLNKYVGQCRNLALILDKYPPAHVPGNSQGKGEWLKRLEPNGHIDTALTQSAYNRWHAMMSATKATLFNATLDWRMVVGLGGETVLETDITLHHLYGIPFIPGSALKGLTRAYLTGEIEGYKSDKIDTDNAEVKRIFGSQEQAGTVLFFDAMPLNSDVKFVVDIMNPHFPEYYNSLKSSRTTPPTNDQQPNPITFLTVTDTTFTFALAPRNSSIEQHVKDVEQVKKWLQEALQKYGVGGKTSAGYGYFKKEMSSIEPTQPQKAAESMVQTQVPSKPTERIRPPLPQFKEGQEIRDSVVLAPTEELRQRMPKANAFLRYREFSTRDAFVVIGEEFPEARNWKPGEMRICVFVGEEQHDDYVAWICKPRVKKDRDKKK